MVRVSLELLLVWALRVLGLLSGGPGGGGGALASVLSLLEPWAKPSEPWLLGLPVSWGPPLSARSVRGCG